MDEPRLLRIYPLADRYLADDHKTPKWRIISAEVARTSSDPRPESYKIQPLSIRAEGHLDTADGWAERRRILLRDEFLVGGIEDIERRQELTGQSLGIVKPVSIEDVIVRRVSRSDLEERRTRYEEIFRQQELWPPGEAPVPPRQFDVRVRFRGPEDSRVYDRVILDWEVYALAGNLRAKGGILEDNLRDALLRGAFDPAKKDVHLMLGNISSHPQEFVVVAIFYPPIPKPPEPERQVGMFG
ncbi:MAG: hypothetical protein Q8P18_21490 [Pseudomonadota bacterium]|nr:hypothetical protein [Pseudomonadota bacterium]